LGVLGADVAVDASHHSMIRVVIMRYSQRVKALR
jgi:hypothetical protein